jgi:hypothetical protein
MILGALACTPERVRNAPFRVRPDSVKAGDLRGPFNGRVVDASTGRAVAGALVYATWTRQKTFGTPSPAGYSEFVTSTDAGGFYEVPAVGSLDEASGDDSARLTDFYLVIYKRGYVAYRSDRRFADLGPRMDFAQSDHRISLERWRSDFSHARHLRYIGGGPALATLTAWEVEDAADELSGRGDGRIDTDILPGIGGGPYLVAGQLLRSDEIALVTGYDGTFETGPLGDEPDTQAYTSQHFKALGRAENFDVALRIWRLDESTSQDRYNALLDTLPRVEQRNEIADRSLRAKEADIFGVAFLDKQRHVVVLLTCGEAQCTNSDMAADIAGGIHERIVDLWPITPDEDE